MITLLTIVPLLISSRFLPFYRVVLNPTDHAALLIYQREFLERSKGIQVSCDYLSNAYVAMFFWGTRSIGGYVINVSEWNPLRYLMLFTPTMSNAILNDKGLREEEMLEISCIWKAKLPMIFTAIFYAGMLIDSWRIGRRMGKRYLLGGSVLKSIRKIHRLLLPIDIFIGFLPSTTLSTKADQLVAIYAGPLNSLPLRATNLLVSRFLLPKNLVLRLSRYKKTSISNASNVADG
ncbi:hypothetical protein [Spirosoma sp.]|uniref:hypothetical protein n=1 Tax=Spirosoma sp. TaxID=1899569 RepID=UPI0026114703|nr:hypothetical protein [Spirosoma sp.]MCX6212826.1 hypothetical protein [Spirosoma sp.]